MPSSSALRASLRLSAQLPVQRSATVVTARPDEQFAPNKPIFSRLPLYIVTRSRMEAVRAITVPSSPSAQGSMAARRVVSIRLGAEIGAEGRRKQRFRSKKKMAFPAKMTVIAIKAPGGPEMLVPEERPV